VTNAKKLLDAKEVAELDVLQLEVDREGYRTERDAAKRSVPGAFRRLAAHLGVQELPERKVLGDLNSPLPELDLETLRGTVMSLHPEIRAAQVEVERTQLAIRRAEVEPIPNVTLSAGYVRQSQNRSNDWMIGMSVPVPIWNKNEGNILAAKAAYNVAQNEVGRVQNELVRRLGDAYATYASAKERAEQYQAVIVPKAEKSYQLSLKAYQGGEFEYLRVLQSQRVIAEARLEAVRSRGEAWRALSEISGLILQDIDQTPSSPQP
jgi:outer membrane protein, heavy metal efflux system